MMKNNRSLIAIAALILISSVAPAMATSCSADISFVQGGALLLTLSTDAKGATSALILDATGAMVQEYSLRRGGVQALVSFAAAPGQHFDVVFVNRKRAPLCVDGIDIPIAPDPGGN